MRRRFGSARMDRAERAAAARVRATTEAAPGSARDYWTGIVIGYLAAVLTSIGVMLMFIRHGW